MSLRKQTFSAVRFTTVAMICKVSLQLLQVSILARLLTPADFGLMAIVVAVLGFAQIFSDMGVSNAIIHHQSISSKKLSTLYWLNVFVGIGLMLLLMLLSTPIAQFYKKPELQLLLILVSSTFFITALGQQLRVVAEKKLKFKVLAKIEITVAIISTTMVVIWAIYSPSVIVLVIGGIVSALLNSLFYWLLLAQGWRPMRYFKVNEIGEFLSFGAFTMADGLLNSINRQADIFIGGRIFSAESLGIYNLPRDLSLRIAGVINPVITRVGLPVMAKSQGDLTQLKNIYLKTQRMTASINFPLYFVVVIFAPEIIYLLFGAQWQDSIPLLRIFALWGMLRSTGNPIGSLLYARGRSDLSFKWNFSLFMIVTPVIWFASNWGAIGMALSLLGKGLFFYIPSWFFLVRPLCGAGLWEYTLNLLIPLIAATLAALVAYYAVTTLEGHIIRLSVGCTIGAIIYIGLSLLINKQWIGAMRELLFSRA